MRLDSIQIGPAQTLDVSGRAVTTGIDKAQVDSARITADGVVGDTVADVKHHGGPDQAVYVYTRDDYAWWERELGTALPGGRFGENLTVSSLGPEPLRIGDRIHVGEVLLEIAAARIPCGTLEAHVGAAGLRQRFHEARRPGPYCRVIEEGVVRVGDTVRRLPAPETNLTLLDLYDLLHESDPPPDRLRAALAAPIAERARARFEQRLG